MNLCEVTYKTLNKVIDSVSTGYGGPFGAAIFKDKIICISTNRVLIDKDPTAHAEIVAIREACKILNTYDLTGYSIYATGFPCPMCMSAIIWANIKDIYYSATYEDAKRLGFRDDYICDFIKNDFKNNDIHINHIKKDGIINLYNNYKSKVY